jgi:hypothetical protein
MSVFRGDELCSHAARWHVPVLGSKPIRPAGAVAHPGADQYACLHKPVDELVCQCVTDADQAAGNSARQWERLRPGSSL